jgi:hypothetical protein
MRGAPAKAEPLPVRLLDFDLCYEEWPAPASAASPFDAIEWLDSAEVYLHTLLNAEAADRLAIEHYIVPVCMLVAEVAIRKGQVRVLDFGGGVGVNFVTTTSSILRPTGIAGNAPSKIRQIANSLLKSRDRVTMSCSRAAHCNIFPTGSRC